MFKSKLRPLAIPQSEHLKLAGTLALLWGNATFARPPVPFASFVAGVALHDRAYGPLDNLPILETPEPVWLDLARRGFALDWEDPVAGAIAMHHIHRLTSYGHAPLRQSAAHEMAAGLKTYLARHSLDPQTFARIDCITRLCDDIAFAFCFEAPTAGTVTLFAAWDRAEEIDVHYEVAGGTIAVDPWPFSVREHQGYLLGYRLPAYPATLDPILVFYTLQARA